MGELRAYAALLGGQVRSAASYRASFVVEMITNIGATALDVVTVFVLFRVAATVGGFTLAEALLMTGITAAGFVLADFAVGNVDRLKAYVRSGTLDAVLVRPLAVLPQLLLMDLPMRKALRLVVGLGTLGVAVGLNDIPWTPARAVLVVVAPVSAAVFFGGIFVLRGRLIHVL